VSFWNGADRVRTEIRTASAWWIYGVLPGCRPGFIKLKVSSSSHNLRRDGLQVGTYVEFQGSITGGKAIDTGVG